MRARMHDFAASLGRRSMRVRLRSRADRASVLGKLSSLNVGERMSETVWGEGKMERNGASLGLDALI